MMNRIFPRTRFLGVFVVIFTFLLGLMISDSLRDCDGQELTATKSLLKKYANRLEEMKSDQIILRKKLSEAEEQLVAAGSSQRWVKGLPVIYLITPTYTRLEQKAELTRFSHTLKLVRNVHWVVIEDTEQKSQLVTNFLQQTGLNYTHLNVITPAQYKLANEDPNWLKPRGVLQRNAGLDWLLKNTSPEQPGVVYFADDDNTYSLKLFEEMRYTKKVSVWPVGLVGYLRYESPVIKDGKVVGWFTYWKPKRPFALDMAGFAINLNLIHNYPDARFSNFVQRGYQESTLLSGMQIVLEDLEPKAKMCTEVLVWHTRTEKSKTKNEEKMVKLYGAGSDPNIEV
ncbi:galactosylgalactosylxylosylprotein 3-beta-glucuronosyltransferase 3-like [Physella acuta]|uniref:galactosylgalactosylxylosylprotein 3-beta-glucuronosyltransferase 3-like n=1 Tax=Physella acuta TaxID=109671 RepID=UPI0027DC84D6|nr:galactosylgalactosylxylosylprotein 3-beta-glucuronosyltransferase 3-like [Physella acuta]XP_059162275.1 galactosylgalactosylxylosylprotein 3-beta-glucuronosyltransferase 3-like [Physella acuta]XP_059162276.1 galactosylgalactosylxylosylprotein 3-beta-glucuronosyltransferase 3-like [Physella acuta]XP_059162277.1 galactosylgalactosylxylosylprotein 3-beta-glucuronosyltransferase 3-like [Physella acuta]